MQYTASSFARPLMLLFRLFLQPRDEIHEPRGLFPQRGSLHTHAPDLFRRYVYGPLFAGIGFGSVQIALAARGTDPDLRALHRPDDPDTLDLEARLTHVPFYPRWHRSCMSLWLWRWLPCCRE